MLNEAKKLAAAFYSQRALYAAQQAVKYRAWAKDKTHRYAARLQFDRWAADAEWRVILCARAIEALYEPQNA